MEETKDTDIHFLTVTSNRFRGVWPAEKCGHRSACGHIVVCVVQQKDAAKTDFHPIDLPLFRGCRGDEEVSSDVVFYGVTVVVCMTPNLCRVTERKTNICSFSKSSKSQGTTCGVPVHYMVLNLCTVVKISQSRCNVTLLPEQINKQEKI